METRSASSLIKVLGSRSPGLTDSPFPFSAAGIRIYFHQATFQRGQLFPDIRQAHEAMLNLINYSESFQDHLPPAVALPLFLGASASLETSQRAQWVKVLRGLGQHRGYADNLLVIEEVWKGVDASGRTVDWLELVRQGVVEPPAFP